MNYKYAILYIEWLHNNVDYFTIWKAPTIDVTIGGCQYIFKGETLEEALRLAMKECRKKIKELKIEVAGL